MICATLSTIDYVRCGQGLAHGFISSQQGGPVFAAHNLGALILGIMNMNSIASNFQAVSANQPTVIFIGSGFSFSDHLLGMAGNDLAHISVERLETASNSDTASADAMARAVAVVFDQCDVGELVAFVDHLKVASPNAMPVMAYKSDAMLANILPLLEREPALAALSLLPMRLQVDSWLSVLRLLVCGERYLPCSVLRPTAIDASNPEAAPAPPKAAAAAGLLTDREREVLEEVSKGKQNKLIAEDLSLSIHTVKLHLHNIIAKLGVRNRTEATLWFIQNGGATAATDDPK